MAGDQAGPSNRDAADGDQQIVKAERKQVAHQADDIKSMLQAMAVQQHKDGIKEQYEFWETQPVAQFNEDPSKLPVLQDRRIIPYMSFCLKAWPVTKECALQQEDGAIDPPKTVQDVRPEPYPLPDRFPLFDEHSAMLCNPILFARRLLIAAAVCAASSGVNAISTTMRWSRR